METLETIQMHENLDGAVLHPLSKPRVSLQKKRSLGECVSRKNIRLRICVWVVRTARFRALEAVTREYVTGWFMLRGMPCLRGSQPIRNQWREYCIDTPAKPIISRTLCRV